MTIKQKSNGERDSNLKRAAAACPALQSASGEQFPRIGCPPDKLRHRKAPRRRVKASAIAKSRSAEDESGRGTDNEDEPEVGGEESAGSDDDGASPYDSIEESAQQDGAGSGGGAKHIHPCICDLTKKQRQKIDSFLQRKRSMQFKHERRVKEIVEELARIEEDRLERERELQEQQELFGDEYELVGSKRKRKKRSARRASMVSLGVKQVINWRKAPRVEVKSNRTSRLRTKYSSYCRRLVYSLSPVREIDFRKEPQLSIRETVTSTARSNVNIAKKEFLVQHEDKRKRFETPYYV